MCLDKTWEATRAGDNFGKTKKIILACGIILGIGLGLVLFGLFLLKRRKSPRAVIELRGI